MIYDKKVKNVNHLFENNYIIFVIDGNKKVQRKTFKFIGDLSFGIQFVINFPLDVSIDRV